MTDSAERSIPPSSNPSLDATERFYAEMESERNRAADEYFEARPQIMRTYALDAIYRAGFERAYRQLWPRLAQAEAMVRYMVEGLPAGSAVKAKECRCNRVNSLECGQRVDELECSCPCHAQNGEGSL